MKFLFISFLALTIAAVVVGELQSFEIPCLTWSGKNHYKSKSEINEVVHSDQINSILNAFLPNKIAQSENIASKLNEVETSPEVIVLFLEPEFRTDLLASGKFSSLKHIMESSTSSITIPRVHLRAHQYSLVDSTLREIVKSDETNVVYSGFSNSFLAYQNNVRVVTPSDFLAYLEDAEIFTNGVTDLLVVHLDAKKSEKKFSDDDKLIKSVVDIVSSATNDNYVAVFTSERSLEPYIDWYPQSLKVHKKRTFSQYGEEPHRNWFESHFPGWFWQAFFTAIALFIIGGCGFTAMASLQSPDKWESTRKKKLVD
eukprot:TRINITY_DN317_c0_g1_i1.p1 TRINITY_DN317_c0_g1~~TRINITY_DN317_c0_g1_i1.p1  ORF type:complete len:313 (-),score=55.30 TRINITY_DN317_c0_g1_i1:76-1014(-)